MRLHRFIGNYNLKEKNLHIIDGEFYNQIKNVLRLEPDDYIILADGKGHEAETKITAITPGVIDCMVVQQKDITTQPKRNVTLYCAMLKGDHFELVAQKATEIGITTIVPLITKRTVKLNCKHERIEKIMKEAAEQCGRVDVPTLQEIMPFATAVEQATQHTINLFFDMSGTSFSATKHNSDDGLGSRISVRDDNRKTIAIFIGPEGGWDPREIAIAQEHNFTIAGLGAFTLRAETAAIVASYLAVHRTAAD